MASGFPVKIEVSREAAFTYEGTSPTSSVLTMSRVGECDTVERSGAAAQFDVRREVSSKVEREGAFAFEIMRMEQMTSSAASTVGKSSYRVGRSSQPDL